MEFCLLQLLLSLFVVMMMMMMCLVVSECPSIVCYKSVGLIAWLQTLRHRDTSAPRHFGTGAELRRRDDWSFMGAIGLHAKLSGNVINRS